MILNDIIDNISIMYVIFNLGLSVTPEDGHTGMKHVEFCTPYNINTHINVFIVYVYIYYLMLFA
jgi:hypothetical protein